MTKVRIGEHRWVNVSRRSLCDNCRADICFKRLEMIDDRIQRCDMFRSSFLVIKKCVECGALYELFSNLGSPDFEKCPVCNERASQSETNSDE